MAPGADADHFALLGLAEDVDDPAAIEAAYRQAKRLWDGRRHNPAYRHEVLRMQESLALAFQTLRDPSRRRRHRVERAARRRRREAEIGRELAGWVRLAVDAGWLTPEARDGLVGRGVALGLTPAAARQTVLEIGLEAGVREGRPAGIDALAERRATFRWFVERAVAGRVRGPLPEASERMLERLAVQFGFGSWRLEDAIEFALAANRRRTPAARFGRWLARGWARLGRAGRPAAELNEATT